MNWGDTKVQFEPWYGEEYDKGIEGRRVLILGESHHHSCDADPECEDDALRSLRHRNLTRLVVEDWMSGPHSSSVSYKVPDLFGMTKADFWKKVVFYNYLQSFAGPKARHRPKPEQWDDDSAFAFQSVLDEFEPDRIMVLGKDTWTNLPSSPTTLAAPPIADDRLHLANKIGNRNEADGVACCYASHSGKLALAMPVIHPTAASYSAADWIPYINPWLNISLPPISL